MPRTHGIFARNPLKVPRLVLMAGDVVLAGLSEECAEELFARLLATLKRHVLVKVGLSSGRTLGCRPRRLR